MKRYILMIMCCVATMMTYAQNVNCTSISDTAVTISRWGEFYTPVPNELECWTVDLNVEGAVKITYNVDLDLFDAIDHVIIYELDANDQATSIRWFCATTESGVLVSASHRFKVEYWGFTGNETGLYEGFQLHFEKASQEHVVNNDYYVLGKLGIGTTHPKAKLHVNGSIYGGEALGATRFQSDGGYVTIGTAGANRKIYMQFTTDLEKFVFNQPIFTEAGVLGSSTNSLQFIANDSVRMAINGGNVGVGIENPQETLHVNGAIRGGGTNGEVTLKGDNGSVTIGATDAQTMTFNTDKSKYAFNVNGINRMTIQNNGNVGIGLSTPYGRLHINGGALRLGVGSSEAARTANVLEFGDNSYVKIGEWQKDNMLSFKAHSFNFNVGNVGIGTTTPQYNLDVAGTIRAEELIVETTGADYVFADDYQLRPLSEVEAFITENKHLPEIQSAQEMQENGVSVSELQTKLLQKIEELTLYILQQEERIQQQELRIKTLEMK